MSFHRVDLNLLAVFYAIFETRCVTAAAERFDADPAIAWMRRQLFESFGEGHSFNPKTSAAAV
ncbi:MAG TPA: hypothetical protein VGA88_06630 [Burkholderiales bacterium]|jgi:hypothetical protein